MGLDKILQTKYQQEVTKLTFEWFHAASHICHINTAVDNDNAETDAFFAANGERMISDCFRDIVLQDRNSWQRIGKLPAAARVSDSTDAGSGKQ